MTMAFGTDALKDYDTLKATVASWTHRTDLTVSVPEFIALAESRLGRELALLDWEASAEASLIDSKATLPTEYKTLRRVTNEDGNPLEYRTPSQFAIEVNSRILARAPSVYTLTGFTLEVGQPVGDGTKVFIDYIARLVPLSDSNQTNWLLENHPDLLFYGSMENAMAYIKDEAREAKWANRFNQALGALLIEDEWSRTTGEPLRIRST